MKFTQNPYSYTHTNVKGNGNWLYDFNEKKSNRKSKKEIKEKGKKRNNTWHTKITKLWVFGYNKL